MVLDRSDYSLPEMGETMNPMEPTSFVSRLAGLTVVFSAVYFAWRLAKNRGAPLIDQTAGSLTGGLLSSSGDGGDDMWDGV
jgi:hypothetical protein